MIGMAHLIRFTLSDRTMVTMREHAEMKCLGHGSRIYGKEFTEEELFEWQLIGCICAYAVTYKLTGSTHLYYKHIEDTGGKPVGDGGTDIPGARVDVKGSLIRANLGPLGHHLLVRPEEYHKDTLYVQSLVKSYSESEASGWIIGMMESWEIPSHNRPKEKFGNAYAVPCKMLHSFPRIRWER